MVAERAHRYAQQLGDRADRVLAVGSRSRGPLDVASEESAAGAVRLVREHTDRMDVLINNAGTPGGGVNPADATAKDIHAVYDTNVYGPVRVTHAFLPLLQAADNPRVVMVTGAGVYRGRD
ncbi:SDR family NAD(P)-dependent oxidoreductase [Nonomuraea sp. SYSU D8015]|uniref:SDR family NAD(P)-dependent oxidoreductase n=1 Tax=Nonomuraea sp. SYSU D8015 TaxID=2593644 RepID=UPI001CB72EF2